MRMLLLRIIIIIINEKISVAFSPKTARTCNTQKDMFGRQRKKQEGQQRRVKTQNRVKQRV